MKRILSIVTLMLAFACAGNAQEKGFIKGYSGGMFVHTGYQQGGDNPYDYEPSGSTFGIGGLVKIRVTEHFRFGAEGYFSSMGLMKNGSFNKLFWSGPLVDWVWDMGKFHPYAGLTLGGGMETAYYMFEGDKNDWLPETMAVFNKKPFFAADPFIGVEYSVGKAFRLSLKADWLLAINSEGLNRPMGPRLYFGFVFAH